MADKVVPGPVDSAALIQEAVSINTEKIFDSCRDKDCVDDLRVYPTVSAAAVIESSISIRPRGADLLYVAMNVEPISFNRGFYTIDCTYFYRVTGEAFPSGQELLGLAVFDKRVMLFGSEGSAMTFSSDDMQPHIAGEDIPVAKLTAVDPIALQMKIVDNDAALPDDQGQIVIPDFIAAAFPEDLLLTDTPRRWYATIGQFSIVRLERDTQLLIPAYNYSLPEKDCPGSTPDDPCELFSRINFPMEEFFPPDSVSDSKDYRSLK